MFDWDDFQLVALDGRKIAYTVYRHAHDMEMTIIDSDGEYLEFGIHDDDYMSVYGYVMEWAFRHGYKVIRSEEV